MNSINQQSQKEITTQLSVKDKLKHPALIILILVLICGGCYLCSQSSLLWDIFLCSNDAQNKIPSPNGKYLAITFLKDCGGAASAFTPHVSILKPGDKLHKYQEGNIFVGSKGEYFIRAKWITDTHLVIVYTLNRNLLPTLMATNKDGILIEYKKVELKRNGTRP